MFLDKIKKRKNKIGENPTNFNKSTSSNQGQTEKKLTIEAVEGALKKPHKTEDKIFLLHVAGDAYNCGDIGAEKDFKKSAQYYKEAADLGDVECLCLYGKTLIMDYCGNDEMLFSIGVLKVCQSYQKGYEPAKETLQYLIDNIFVELNSIDDLLELSKTL